MASRVAVTILTRANRIATTIGRNNAQLKNFAFISAAAQQHQQQLQQLLQNHVRRAYSTEKAEQKTQEQQQQQQSAASGGSQNDEIQKLSLEVERLSNSIKSLTEQNAELMDKYKRALAESENIRTRLTKQIADAKVFGIQSFCKDLLDVADILQQATAAVPMDAVNDSNPHLKNLYEGLKMTQASMLQVFKRHGLEPVDPLHQKFDPHLHEALFQKEDSTVEPNIIVEVTKLGYKLHDRIIRPALVGVSKAASS